MDTKKLEEKLKYLILLELRERRIMLQNFGLEVNYDSDKKIEFYEADFRVDYEGVIDAEWNSFKDDVQKMFSHVEEALTRFPINREGKIDLSFENFYISEPLIWDIIYEYDSKHDFHFSFRVNLDLD
jgi:hypothetical protein